MNWILCFLIGVNANKFFELSIASLIMPAQENKISNTVY